VYIIDKIIRKLSIATVLLINIHQQTQWLN